MYHGAQGARQIFSLPGALAGSLRGCLIQDSTRVTSASCSPPELFGAAGAMAELGRRTPMLDAAVKALSQMISPPFRAVLWKSVGLALVLIVIIGIAVQRLLVWLATYGTDWAEG